MANCSLFYTGDYLLVAEKVQAMLNAQLDFLTASTVASTRAAGDAIQSIVAEHLQPILGEKCVRYNAEVTRREMADLTFTDTDGFEYLVDVKTHRVDTKFNMPNLTSVERLARLYENSKNYFVLLLVAYIPVRLKIAVERVHFVPIEFLGWDCLTIGALGWGQIQIANASKITINAGYSRTRWMVELCDRLLRYYPHEMDKIEKRIRYFERIKQVWASRQD